jgi:hypothetical protein
MKIVFLIFVLMFNVNTFAQELNAGKIKIKPSDAMTGSQDRSAIAFSCVLVADAAVNAHAAGKLSDVINQAAKVMRVGSSDDPYFNELVKRYNFDSKDEFLFSALFFSKINIMWLDQKQPYSKEIDSLYKSYVAATCAQVAKFS